MVNQNTCAAPGCDAVVSSPASGVCRSHLHSGCCCCVHCSRERGAVAALPDQDIGPLDVRACRELWGVVLVAQWRLAVLEKPSVMRPQTEITAARRWFGSEDFRIVCTLAGIDPDYLMRGLPDYLDRVSQGEPKTGMLRRSVPQRRRLDQGAAA